MPIEEKGRRSTFTRNFISVEFACLSCHAERDNNWAFKNAENFHKNSPLGGRDLSLMKE